MRVQWLIAVGITVTAAAIVVVVGIERGSAPALVLFAGRFHPTLVHFPIAFLILGAIIEILAPRWPRARQVRPAVPFIFGFGAVSALAAAVLGYLLSLGGGYAADLLSLHMWLGWAVFALSAGIAAASALLILRGRVYRSVLTGLVALVLVTGHLGGSLARGSDYLTYYLPEPVKRFAGFGGNAFAGLITDVDSAVVYTDLVQPILDRRCVKCHGESKSKGDLRLDTREGIERGGRDGVLLTPGNPGRSEIVRRITLPPFDDDAMPPRGEPPLDVGETEIIRWWIDHGASFQAKVGHVEERPSAVDTYIRRVSAPQAPRRSGIFALDISDADSAVVDSLRQTGLLIARIDPKAPFLEVSAANLGGRFSDDDLAALRPIALQISRLDVSGSGVTTRAGGLLAEMRHLTHLSLNETDVDGDILQALSSLEYLEYLNLYHTGISNQDLEHVSEMKTLASLYLWRTHVSAEGLNALQRSRPGLYVNIGSELIPADSVSVQ